MGYFYAESTERSNAMNLSLATAQETLTLQALEEIAEYTIQKINNYPKSFGKTVENYFDLLFPDEVKNYLMRRAINGSI